METTQEFVGIIVDIENDRLSFDNLTFESAKQFIQDSIQRIEKNLEDFGRLKSKETPLTAGDFTTLSWYVRLMHQAYYQAKQCHDYFCLHQKELASASAPRRNLLNKLLKKGKKHRLKEKNELAKFVDERLEPLKNRIDLCQRHYQEAKTSATVRNGSLNQGKEQVLTLTNYQDTLLNILEEAGSFAGQWAMIKNKIKVAQSSSVKESKQEIIENDDIFKMDLTITYQILAGEGASLFHRIDFWLLSIAQGLTLDLSKKSMDIDLNRINTLVEEIKAWKHSKTIQYQPAEAIRDSVLKTLGLGQPSASNIQEVVGLVNGFIQEQKIEYTQWMTELDDKLNQAQEIAKTLVYSESLRQGAVAVQEKEPLLLDFNAVEPLLNLKGEIKEKAEMLEQEITLWELMQRFPWKELTEVQRHQQQVRVNELVDSLKDIYDASQRANPNDIAQLKGPLTAAEQEIIDHNRAWLESRFPAIQAYWQPFRLKPAEQNFAENVREVVIETEEGGKEEEEIFLPVNVPLAQPNRLVLQTILCQARHVNTVNVLVQQFQGNLSLYVNIKTESLPSLVEQNIKSNGRDMSVITWSMSKNLFKQLEYTRIAFDRIAAELNKLSLQPSAKSSRAIKRLFNDLMDSDRLLALQQQYQLVLSEPAAATDILLALLEHPTFQKTYNLIPLTDEILQQCYREIINRFGTVRDNYQQFNEAMDNHRVVLFNRLQLAIDPIVTYLNHYLDYLQQQACTDDSTLGKVVYLLNSLSQIITFYEDFQLSSGNDSYQQDALAIAKRAQNQHEECYRQYHQLRNVSFASSLTIDPVPVDFGQPIIEEVGKKRKEEEPMEQTLAISFGGSPYRDRGHDIRSLHGDVKELNERRAVKQNKFIERAEILGLFGGSFFFLYEFLNTPLFIKWLIELKYSEEEKENTRWTKNDNEMMITGEIFLFSFLLAYFVLPFGAHLFKRLFKEVIGPAIANAYEALRQRSSKVDRVSDTFSRKATHRINRTLEKIKSGPNAFDKLQKGLSWTTASYYESVTNNQIQSKSNMIWLIELNQLCDFAHWVRQNPQAALRFILDAIANDSTNVNIGAHLAILFGHGLIRKVEMDSENKNLEIKEQWYLAYAPNHVAVFQFMTDAVRGISLQGQNRLSQCIGILEGFIDRNYRYHAAGVDPKNRLDVTTAYFLDELDTQASLAMIIREFYKKTWF